MMDEAIREELDAMKAEHRRLDERSPLFPPSRFTISWRSLDLSAGSSI